MRRRRKVLELTNQPLLHRSDRLLPYSYTRIGTGGDRFTPSEQPARRAHTNKRKYRKIMQDLVGKDLLDEEIAAWVFDQIAHCG
jgi:hypothetical protein